MSTQKRRRNSNQYTTDEIKTAVTAYTEGFPHCAHKVVRYRDRVYRYSYPSVRIGMCVKEALEPVSRAMNLKITAMKTAKVSCKPEDFPPDGKGFWMIEIPEKKIRKLYPLIPRRYIQEWIERWRKKGCPI